MDSNSMPRIFAGTLILVSLAFGAPDNPSFDIQALLWGCAFVGARLWQSAFKRSGPHANAMKWPGGRIW